MKLYSQPNGIDIPKAPDSLKWAMFPPFNYLSTDDRRVILAQAEIGLVKAEKLIPSVRAACSLLTTDSDASQVFSTRLMEIEPVMAFAVCEAQFLRDPANSSAIYQLASLGLSKKYPILAKEAHQLIVSNKSVMCQAIRAALLIMQAGVGRG